MKTHLVKNIPGLAPLLLQLLLQLLPLLLLQSCSGDQEQQAASRELEATVNQALKAAGATEETGPSRDDRSVAVLPFMDISENSEYGYFAEGLSQGLINRLALIPDLQVSGRESSFQYKPGDKELRQISTALQVENILSGSVRRSGDSLHVTAQLVSANDGFKLWSQTYNRELAEVFAIQDEIVEGVAAALSVTPDAIAISGMPRHIEAYDKTLQAQALYNRFAPDTVLRAINLLEEAVRLDPQFGRGWLLLGNIYNKSQSVLPANQALDFPAQAAQAFARAAESAPDMPELLLVEAASLRNDGRFLEAENLYRRFFGNYGYSVAHAMEEYAQLLAQTGQFNEALAMLNRARRVEPLAPWFLYQAALLEMYRGQTHIVAQLSDRGMGLDGGEYLFSALEWQHALREGEPERAAQLIRQYFEDNGPDANATPVSWHFMERFADILEANDLDASTDNIIAMIKDPAVTPLELVYVVRLMALMGQPQIALDYWFGQSVSPSIWDELYADMRRLPEFNRLLQEKGVVDYWRATGNWGDFCVPAGGRDFVCK